MCVRTYVRPSVHKKFRFWSNLLCGLTSTGYVHQCELRSRSRSLSFWSYENCTFSMAISSAILAWSSKLMVDYDNMGPILQLLGARCLNVLLSTPSRDFKLRVMSILQDFQRAIFLCYLRLESHGRVCWYVLCMLILSWPDPRSWSRSHGDDHQFPSRAFI